jgi:hypothetical protein
MNKSLRFLVGIVTVGLCVFLVGAPPASAQTTVEDALKQLSSDNGKGYMQPVADLFGANMQAGSYHSAAIPKAGFNIAFDIVVMGGVVGDDQKSFDGVLPAGFSPAKTKAPTVFGGEGPLVTDAATDLSYRFPDGIVNTSLFPLLVPQLTVGSIMGTEVFARYIFIPKLGEDALPSTTLWGAGIRHNISQWFGVLPVDIAVGVFYNKFTSGDLIDYTGTQIGAQASKSFSLVTLYGGLAWEQSTMTLTYASSAPGGGDVEIDLDGANTFRVTGGAMLTLGFFRLFADINLGSVTHFSGGIGFGG